MIKSIKQLSNSFSYSYKNYCLPISLISYLEDYARSKFILGSSLWIFCETILRSLRLNN